MTLVLCVILFGLAFEYINGFHDTANAIATVVSTRVLSPRQAVCLAAVCNLIGALWGTAVAATIGNGLVETGVVTLHTVLSALLAAILWNLLTWWFGLPSSSSHALIGGLCGATVASARGDFSVIRWSVATAQHGPEGLWPKVILPMVTSPLVGLLIGFLVMGLLLAMLRNWRPHRVNMLFGRLQLGSAALMGLSHGTNDAQKTMGILALTLWTATRKGLFDGLPAWLHFLHTPQFEVAYLGQGGLFPDHGGGHGRRRLAHHPNHGPSDGPPATHPRLRRRNGRGHGHPGGQSLGHSPVHHARHLGLDPRRGSDPAIKCGEMARRGTHGLGMGDDAAGNRPDRLLARMLAADPQIRISPRS